ncbi:hypothetical protein C1H46_007377 [Malus baccata]|uniref:CCT domain-containing protein n=1 Tax=Malus baccata TaxID=106549 RepID=A0A540N7G3_MALBA|nr:hypothetical protein C1H46_007377 [Malus baccata]
MSSSDLYVVDDSFYRHSTTPEMVDLPVFSEPFSPFSDIELLQLQAISDQQNPADQNSPSLLFSSPPSYQLETLRLYQQTQIHQIDQNSPNFPIGMPNFSPFDALEVKTEPHQAFGPHTYGGAEHMAKFMQRSYSSNCFDGSSNKPDFCFKPSFDSLMESPSFQNQTFSLSSPESSFLAGQMRRVSSTGDLQNFRINRAPRESSVTEEAAANFKMGRYSAEERKERISKYRAKRSQRNFNKTIKYACRKTLADNRPRIRGRFARNDETEEIFKAACSSNREEDEDEFWVEGFNVEEEEMNATVRGGGGGGGGQFMNNFGATQIQYYGF